VEWPNTEVNTLIRTFGLDKQKNKDLIMYQKPKRQLQLLSAAVSFWVFILELKPR